MIGVGVVDQAPRVARCEGGRRHRFPPDGRSTSSGAPE